MIDGLDNIKKHASQQEDSSTFSTAPRQSDKPAIVFPEVNYDVPALDDFLSFIFGESLGADENILVWQVKPKKSPMFPVTDEALLDRLEKTSTPYALYYATATARKTTDTDANGKESTVLRNRKGLFERFHVLVLDDIGTKVPFGKIPDTMKPSYIIESSEGNFQYGYVLAEPLTDIGEAEALINIAYTAGFSDAGGKMANKLVRLPEGLNGKNTERGTWHVKLTELNDVKWSPEDLLKEMCCPMSWDELKNDPKLLAKRDVFNRANASVWSPMHSHYSTLTGVVDPVAEWLGEECLILNETEEWFTIRCPQHDKHTSGGTVAGYSPIGYGENPERRGFHCFHDSCTDLKTPDFLRWVAGQSGIEVDVTDFAAPLLSKYMLDVAADKPCEVMSSGAVIPFSMSAFKGMQGRNVMRVPTMDGKTKDISAVSMWYSSPQLVKFTGRLFDPVNTEMLVKCDDGAVRLNTFRAQKHEPAPVNMEHVDRFLSYIKYLVPDEEAYDYFTQWLCAKVQSLGFRGAAIIMYTQGVQGVGRSTMLRMMEMLIGSQNTTNVPFAELVKPVGFNGWQVSPFVMVEESRSFGDSSFFKNYERLKELVDPTDNMVLINEKYVQPYMARNACSFVFLSNHIDGVRLPEDDRRFYPIANPLTPASPAFFSELRDWMLNTDWAQHVYNWILTQEPDLDMLNSPPPKTAAKLAVIESSRTLGEEVVLAIKEHITGAFMARQIASIISGVAAKTLMDAKLEDVWRLDVKPLTVSGAKPLRIAGKAERIKVFAAHIADSELPDVRKKDLSKEERGILRASVESINEAEVIDLIVERLVSIGY